MNSVVLAAAVNRAVGTCSRCEGCGKILTASDYIVYWDGCKSMYEPPHPPAIPALCESCAEEP